MPPELDANDYLLNFKKQIVTSVTLTLPEPPTGTTTSIIMSNSIVYNSGDSAYNFTTESPSATSDLTQADQRIIRQFEMRTEEPRGVVEFNAEDLSLLLQLSPEGRLAYLNELSYTGKFKGVVEVLEDPAVHKNHDFTPIKESMVSLIEQRSGGDASSREMFLESFLYDGGVHGLAARTDMINLAANRMNGPVGTSLTMDALQKVLANDHTHNNFSEALINLTDAQPLAAQRLAEYLFNSGRATTDRFLADADSNGHLGEFIKSLNEMNSFEISGMTEEVKQSLLQAAMPYVDTREEAAALKNALDAATLERNSREVLDNKNPTDGNYHRQTVEESREQEIEFMRQIYPEASDQSLNSMVESRADWETQDRTLLTEQASAAARTGDVETLEAMDTSVDTLLRKAQAARDRGDEQKAKQLAQLAGEMRGSITSGIQNAIEEVAASNASAQEKEDLIVDIISTAITVGVVAGAASVTGGAAVTASGAVKKVVQDLVKDVVKDEVKAFLKKPTEHAVDQLLGLASGAVRGEEVNGETIPETFSWPPTEERYVQQGVIQAAYHQGLTNATNNDQVNRRQNELTSQ